MSEEDKKLQKHLVDEMMKVSETNPDVMFYMEALMKKYEELEQENINIKQQLLENKISLKDVEYQEKIKLQQKVEQLEKENKELNRMCELYGQSLYNTDLTKAEKRVEQLENIRKEAIEWCKCVINSKTTAGELPNGKRTDMGYCLDLAEPLLKILEWGKDERQRKRN